MPSRTLHYAIIITFLSGIFLPLFFVHNKKESPLEKRELAPFPLERQDRQNLATFLLKFEAFYNDHFGFRDALVYAYSWLNMQLGFSPSSKVIVGKEGWLFFTGGRAVEDYRGSRLFTEAHLKRWKAHLETKYYGLKAQGIAYVFVIAPNKHTIYGEYLPDRIKKAGDKSRYDQLIEYMRASEVPILDLRPALYAAKEQDRVYQKTGTHWNRLGASRAQYTIVEYLSKIYPEIRPVRYDRDAFSWKMIKGQDLAHMLYLQGELQEHESILIKRPSNCKITRFNKRRFYAVDCPREYDVKALIFRDSFFTFLQPYISQYFSKSIYVWERLSEFALLEEHVKKFQPNIVIEEIAERFLKSYKLTSPLPENELFFRIWQNRIQGEK